MEEKKEEDYNTEKFEEIGDAEFLSLNEINSDPFSDFTVGVIMKYVESLEDTTVRDIIVYGDIIRRMVWSSGSVRFSIRIYKSGEEEFSEDKSEVIEVDYNDRAFIKIDDLSLVFKLLYGEQVYISENNKLYIKKQKV